MRCSRDASRLRIVFDKRWLSSPVSHTHHLVLGWTLWMIVCCSRDARIESLRIGTAFQCCLLHSATCIVMNQWIMLVDEVMLYFHFTKLIYVSKRDVGIPYPKLVHSYSPSIYFVNYCIAMFLSLKLTSRSPKMFLKNDKLMLQTIQWTPSSSWSFNLQCFWTLGIQI